MTKSKLTLLLVLTMGGMVPLAGLAQSAPGATAESAAKPAATEKSAARKAPAKKEPITLAENAPSSYTVVKGDTLWDIAGRFLKEPWRWPEIWNMNREQIKDPHWIYPGDVINMSFDANGNPMLSVGGRFDGSGAPGSTVKLTPQVRVDPQSLAIPSIPSKAIGPFLSLPLVVDEGALDNAPKIVATEDSRVIIGAGNQAYVVGLNPKQGVKWQIYRPGNALNDPLTGELLGYEATYLGEARVTRFGEASTVDIVKSTLEINRGDRLTPTVESTLPSYSPRAPEKQLKGAIVSVTGTVSDAAKHSVVSLNLGKRDGVEIGHVLAVLDRGETISTRDDNGAGRGFSLSSLFPSSTPDGEKKPDSGEVNAEVTLPNERNGLVFVFRVFDRLSYGLVMSSRRPMRA
ncbi:MAG TPA: LysM peptidoglycan-binding domain-containing protein, partial [Usitatibacteraceae bacterium]|nr:LysM peptidoglycan-binding domain-containing protein [Usitatibacteraceae bacterium]